MIEILIIAVKTKVLLCPYFKIKRGIIDIKNRMNPGNMKLRE